jgi:hypothetical protein
MSRVSARRERLVFATAIGRLLEASEAIEALEVKDLATLAGTEGPFCFSTTILFSLTEALFCFLIPLEYID